MALMMWIEIVGIDDFNLMSRIAMAVIIIIISTVAELTIPLLLSIYRLKVYLLVFFLLVFAKCWLVIEVVSILPAKVLVF